MSRLRNLAPSPYSVERKWLLTFIEITQFEAFKLRCEAKNLGWEKTTRTAMKRRVRSFDELMLLVD